MLGLGLTEIAYVRSPPYFENVGKVLLSKQLTKYAEKQPPIVDGYNLIVSIAKRP